VLGAWNFHITMSESSIPKIKSSGATASTLSSTSQTSSPVPSQNQDNKNTEEKNENPEENEEESEENEEELEEAEQENTGPRFDSVDIFFYMSLAIMGDVFDGIWVTRIFFAPTTLLFLYLKGVDQMISRNVISQGIELVPMIGWLPISTTMALYTIIMTNHPELFEKLGVAGEALEKISKKK
jgi:hypothetical protein